MSYQVNTQISVEQNFLNLLNTGYTSPANKVLSLTDYTVNNPTDIVPSVNNGQTNTSVVLTGSDGDGVYGNATVYYNRIAPNENRPTAGNVVYCTDGETHQDVIDRINALHKFLPSEVEYTLPVSFPTAGQTIDYVVKAKSNSLVYNTGDLTIHVTNVS